MHPKISLNLRKPTDELGGCCWLPRLVDKVRRSREGTLPLIYRLALGSPLGIDGHFLRFFGLSKEEMFQTVLDSQGDDQFVEQWFLSQPGVTPQRIQAWNHFAKTLGRRGAPGFAIFHLIKWVLYPKAVTHPVSSLFEAIIQDEED